VTDLLSRLKLLGYDGFLNTSSDHDQAGIRQIVVYLAALCAGKTDETQMRSEDSFNHALNV
jgi:hypothetical protein